MGSLGLLEDIGCISVFLVARLVVGYAQSLELLSRL